MGGAYQGTSWRRYKRHMGFLLEREVVLYRSSDGTGGQIDRCALGKRCFDSAAMSGHAVNASAGAIATIADIAAGRPDRDLGARDVFKLYGAAAGGDFHVALRDIG